MRIECPECRELASPLSIAIVAQRVMVRCARCDHESVLVPQQNDSDPPRLVSGSLAAEARSGSGCPKCSAVVKDHADSCASCGLNTAKFEEYALAAAEAGQGSALEEPWQQLLEDWDSEAAHDSFVAQVVKTASYGEAARRYRATASDEARRSRGELMLERIQSMATAALLAAPRKAATEPEPFRNVVVMLLVLLLLAGAGGIYAMLKAQDASPAEMKPKILKLKSTHKQPGTGGK